MIKKQALLTIAVEIVTDEEKDVMDIIKATDIVLESNTRKGYANFNRLVKVEVLE